MVRTVNGRAVRVVLAAAGVAAALAEGQQRALAQALLSAPPRLARARARPRVAPGTARLISNIMNNNGCRCASLVHTVGSVGSGHSHVGVFRIAVAVLAAFLAVLALGAGADVAALARPAGLARARAVHGRAHAAVGARAFAVAAHAVRAQRAFLDALAHKRIVTIADALASTRCATRNSVCNN